MFDLIGSLFSFAFGMIKMGFTLVGDLLEFIFGILGGFFSLLLSLGGFLLAGALILVAIVRRKAYKQRSTQPEGQVYDVDTEEFTSFYDQFREE